MGKHHVIGNYYSLLIIITASLGLVSCENSNTQDSLIDLNKKVIIEESFDQNKRQIKMDRQKLLYSKYNLKQSILDLLEQVQKVI